MHFLSKSRAILIAGVDEAGCGALVGPVVAAAVILHPTQLIPDVMDSKKLNKIKRLKLYQYIIQHALCWSVGYTIASEIDHLNILRARLLAMKRAVLQLSVQPDLVLIDGNKSPIFKNISYQCFKKGDALVPVISAASIVAKVTRDLDMIALDKQYPEYGFNYHNGYPTQLHLKKLMLYGPISHHRKSFIPIKYMV